MSLACALSPPRHALHSLAAGESVRGISSFYELTTPSAGWNRLDSGTLAEGPADLELLTSNGLASIVIWIRKGANLTLDDLVAIRRAKAIKGGVQTYDERRYFMGDGNLIPVSMARYVFHSSGRSSTMLVMTAVTARGGVEIIGMFPSRPEWEGEVEALLSSLQIDEEGLSP